VGAIAVVVAVGVVPVVVAAVPVVVPVAAAVVPVVVAAVPGVLLAAAVVVPVLVGVAPVAMLAVWATLAVAVAAMLAVAAVARRAVLMEGRAVAALGLPCHHPVPQLMPHAHSSSGTVSGSAYLVRHSVLLVSAL
jgi:hypothetical protein